MPLLVELAEMRMLSLSKRTRFDKLNDRCVCGFGKLSHHGKFSQHGRLCRKVLQMCGVIVYCDNVYLIGK